MEVQLWVVVGWRWVEWQCRSQILFSLSGSFWQVIRANFISPTSVFFFSESNFEEETKTPEVKVVEISLMAKESHVYTMLYPYSLPSTLPEVCTDHSELPGGVGMQLVGQSPVFNPQLAHALVNFHRSAEASQRRNGLLVHRGIYLQLHLTHAKQQQINEGVNKEQMRK